LTGNELIQTVCFAWTTDVVGSKWRKEVKWQPDNPISRGKCEVQLVLTGTGMK